MLALAAGAQSQAPPPTPAELEKEVRDNVVNQPLGDGTVADLSLPEEFLRRVADRIVRSSYEERYRIVVKDAETAAPAASPDSSRTKWIAVLAASVAVLAVVWVSIARRKGAAAP